MTDGKLPGFERLKTIVVIVFACLIYFSLQGNQGVALSVTFSDRHLYSAFDEYGFFYIFEFRQQRPLPSQVQHPPSALQKIHYFSRPFDKSQRLRAIEAQQVKIPSGRVSKIVLNRDFIYAIDPDYGVYIFNNADPNYPAEISRFPFYGIRDLAIFENLGFVAAGKNGIYLLDLTDPAKLRILDRYDTAGHAERVFPAVIQYSLTDFQNPGSEQTRQPHYIAFVADGEAGIVLINFQNQEVSLSRLAPQKIFDTPGYAHDVFYKDFFLYIADGTQGIHVFSLLNANEDPTLLDPMGSIDTPGEAYRVVVDRGYLFVADGKGGLFTVRSVNRGSYIEFTSSKAMTNLGDVRDLAISRELAILANAEHGIRFVDIANPAKPVVKSHIHAPGLASPSRILSAFLSSDRNYEPALRSTVDMVKEFFLASILFVLFSLQMCSTVLPASRSMPFFQAQLLFVRYLLKKTHRVVLVENGQLLTDPALQNHSKYRPIVLDNASVGLVMDKKGKMRVVGPGSDLLHPGEALVKTMDLRARSVIIGPENEDPFEPRQPSEDELLFRQRLRRRLQTSAETRDGVEIVSNIIVEFRIRGQPEPERYPFGFERTAAFQALRQDYRMDKDHIENEDQSTIRQLPVELAVQAWRSYLRGYSLQDLFTPGVAEEGNSFQGMACGLHKLIEQVQRFLTQPVIEEVGEDGRLTGRQILNEAYNALEQAGLEVRRVWIVNLRIAPEQAADFLKHWIATWQDKIRQESLLLKARIEEIRGVSRQRALLDFVRCAMKTLFEGMQRYRTLPEQFLDQTQSLRLLIQGTRSLGSLSAGEKLRLDLILDWLERQLEQ